MEAFKAAELPLQKTDIDPFVFMESLIDASTRLEVYKTKLAGSKLEQSWFLPTLQQKEAVASALIEGTQTTLDGVLVDQVNPNEKDKSLVEIRNYLRAAQVGYRHLMGNQFSVDFIKRLHRTLLEGSVRKGVATVPGEFRTRQNYIGQGKEILYTPPLAEDVESLMENFILYLNDPSDTLRPLVRAAIMHAQFETIHPFMDGNGRVGRMLIPLYLYKCDQISLPCFFISEALERDKFKYYDLLTGIRMKNDWNSWIDFFLQTVDHQCAKYITIVDKINELYEADLERAKAVIKNNKIVDVVNLLYKFPIISTAMVAEHAKLPPATVSRYLNALVDAKILYTDGKSRNRSFFYYDLLNVLR